MLLLIVGDAAALVLFVVIGLVNHENGITLTGLARTGLPLLAAWFALAPIVGTYARPGPRTLVVNWVIAIPTGVAIRAVTLHRAADGSQVVFGIVALIATLVLLLAVRAIATFAAARWNRG